MATTTQADMIAAILKIKDDFGMPFAKAFVEEHTRTGGKIAEIFAHDYEKVELAAKQRHEELTALRNAV